MLFYLKFLTSQWGPFRIMGSHLALTCLGAMLTALVVYFFLPKFWNRLPRDRGRAFVKEGSASVGKPTGAGILILSLTFIVLLFVLPFADLKTPFAPTTYHAFFVGIGDILARPSSWLLRINSQWAIVACLCAAMYTGYLDDKATQPWGRWKKGILDAVVAIITAFFLCRGQSVEIWFPFFKTIAHLSWWSYIAIAAPLLWLTMNATNCSDGVDGLAGTLTLMSLVTLTVILYGVVGHETVARYLLVPHNPEGARWGILMASVAGGVAGYLWYNAEPSKVLMGDAGSRFLGLLVGVGVLASGNPFFVLVVAPIVLWNGATGLIKVSLLKLLAKLKFETRNPDQNNGAASAEALLDAKPPCLIARWLHKFRFPFHDHCRSKHKWTNAQVLMRFVLIQALLMPLLLIAFIKIR